MGLFDALKRRATQPAGSAAPSAVEAAAGDDVLCAPVSGTVIAMRDVPDPVFGGEIMGKGCAIWPNGETVYAPVDGTVSVVMGHAVGIEGAHGVEVLVHVGIDTVEMNGKGFTPYVQKGDTVRAGQPLLDMDRAAIAAEGYPDCVVLAVSNSAAFADVALAVATGTAVTAGEVVVRVDR